TRKARRKAETQEQPYRNPASHSGYLRKYAAVQRGNRSRRYLCRTGRRPGHHDFSLGYLPGKQQGTTQCLPGRHQKPYREGYSVPAKDEEDYMRTSHTSAYQEMMINSKLLEVPRGSYQRELNAKRVRKIAAKFDPRLVNPPK